MSQKKKHTPFRPAPAPSKARVERALQEHRTHVALDLAKTLHKQDPSAENRDLLKQACLARGRDLASQGQHREAAEVFLNATKLVPEPSVFGEAGKELAAAGQAAQALALREQVTDETVKARILAHVADEAVRQGAAARAQLPAVLHAGFDATLQAFAAAEAGQDEQARELLQAVGLRSPFLEWKVFLRGLLAHAAGDNDKALENWQRLDPLRWPFRLAAPLRFAIDKAFAAQQPPATQAVLQQQADRLTGSPVTQQLRGLQGMLASDRQLPQAFRLAESLVPALRQQAPDLATRLGACFYWAIVHHGMPEDVKRYRRVFGVSPDDPELQRLEALACEDRGLLAEAHGFWQKYEKTVEKSKHWPPEQRDRIRAMIWERMGDNAAGVPDLKDDASLPAFLRHHPDRPRPLKPGPAECFAKSLQLAPDRLATYESLLDYQLKRDDAKAAEAAARQLLAKFPDHAATLEQLGDLLMKSERYAEALGVFRRALNSNPLEQRVRRKVSNAHAYHARQLTEEGRFDEARAAYQAALALDDRSNPYGVLCKWAACEYKAGNPARGDELLAKAHAEQSSRLAVVFIFLIETIRFKLSKLKPKVNTEFNELLAQPASGPAAAALASTAASLQQAGVKYHGQQTHEKKVLGYLEKALKARDFDSQELRQVCAALILLKKPRLLQQYIQLGQKRFPADPFFYVAEVQYEVEQGPYRYNNWRATRALEKARELANALPRGDERDSLLKQLQNMEQVLVALNPFGALLSGLGGLGGLPLDDIFGGGPDEFDDEQEDF